MAQKSRRELIEWLGSLGIEISGIEDLGRGVAICRLLSIIHEDFPSNFVRNPSGETDYLRNMKICQGFFMSRNIKLYFPVDKLVKCKMQDNLEVAQWLASYYAKKMGARRPGDAPEGRKEALLPGPVHSSRKKTQGSSSKAVEEEDTAAACCLGCRNAEEVISAKDNRIRDLEDKIAQIRNQALQVEVEDHGAKEETTEPKSSPGGFDHEEVQSLLMTFERERDFYFKKLFTIERYFLDNKDLDEGLRNDMFAILYEENIE